jgi:hypothetical protein
MTRQLWAKTKNKDLFTTADKCLEGECSIDDVDDLLGELRRTIRCVPIFISALEYRYSHFDFSFR